jgi:hypothetical protein
MPFKKWFTSVKKPTVTVQTKKMSEGECCMPKKHHCCGKIFLMLLLLLNVVLTGLVLCQQRNVESNRVGGMENYKMLQQVFKSEGFKAQQKQQIQQAMQMYQIPTTDTDDAKTLPAAQ